MGIFRRRKKEEAQPDEPEVDYYSPQMLAKRLLWDIIPDEDIPQFVPLMGLVPDSPDVAELEQEASHARLAAVAPLLYLLEHFAPLASGITSSAILVNSGERLSEELARSLFLQHRQIILASSVAIIANLLDMGVLTYSDGVQFGE